ncbi:MAG: hypothetical protein NTX22_09595 [Ignavibacteriales bacterium]|nr:hypothetical protein [Ignavibacteriales bacterium]
MKKISLVIFLSLLFTKTLFSQVDDHFGYIDENEIKQFGKPLVTSLGIAMNTGAFHSASIPKIFGFSIGIRGMIMMIPDKQKTFMPNLPDGYKSTTGKDETATFFGNEGGIYSGPGGFITYPNGINESTIPFIFPQATVSFMGTELLLRYVPLKIKDTKIDLIGVGLKHSISQYIPLLPVDIAVQVLYNNFSVQDLVTSTHFAFSGQVSKTFSMFTLYGGLQYESSKLKFEYNIKGDPKSANPLLQKDRKVSADVDGDNSVRLTVGGTFSLAFLVINADYSLGSQSVASAGLTFEF